MNVPMEYIWLRYEAEYLWSFILGPPRISRIQGTVTMEIILSRQLYLKRRHGCRAYIGGANVSRQKKIKKYRVSLSK